MRSKMHVTIQQVPNANIGTAIILMEELSPKLQYQVLSSLFALFCASWPVQEREEELAVLLILMEMELQ